MIAETMCVLLSLTRLLLHVLCSRKAHGRHISERKLPHGSGHARSHGHHQPPAIPALWAEERSDRLVPGAGTADDRIGSSFTALQYSLMLSFPFLSQQKVWEKYGIPRYV